ncbi:unnamed protein product [Meloidogyne enterolobii]|uniref:Uncharacterized protein n=1 Tax=Meloidogyne enterolobii TaxID=390850 RepID=A0ACB0ZVR3_MELEN
MLIFVDLVLIGKNSVEHLDVWSAFQNFAFEFRVSIRKRASFCVFCFWYHKDNPV